MTESFLLLWPKLLTIAHAITVSIHAFLPLYYTHMFSFEIHKVAILSAVCMVLKLPASIIWISLVDYYQPLQGVFIGLLTAIGSAGVLIALSVPPSWTTLTFPAAALSSVIDGLFYQPIEVLVDSAIIKMLGDYKILYVKEREWGKYTLMSMCIIIGWFLDDDHDFDTLVVVLLLGSLLLFLLSLSTNVQAVVDPGLLDIYGDDETISSNKNTLQTTDSFITIDPYPYYKPYSLFKEHLSHISEEDASMLQNIATLNSNSLRPFSRGTSACSSRPSLNHSYHACINHNNTATNQISHSALSQNVHICSSHYMSDNPMTVLNFNNDHPFTNSIPPSFELVRLPFPSPEAPVIVLISYIPGLYTKKNGQRTQQSILEEDPFSAHNPSTESTKQITNSFMGSLFMIGVTLGMSHSLNYIYFHDTLGLPMHCIGLFGSLFIAADIIAHHWVYWLIQHVQPYCIVVFTHAILIICSLAYTYLQPEVFWTKIYVLILQCLQGFSFSLLWLLSTYQVDSVILIDHQRLKIKGIMAAFYTGLGPALGILTAGYIIGRSENNADGYCIVYQYSCVITMISSVLSWKWSTSD
ncbi:hypothetical protein BDB01DRAFT_811871 [Pilobolus umbonatus]|nr:hypothetical protein BDB01DRAFT_811871 [Pilobolus umbonatus]